MKFLFFLPVAAFAAALAAGPVVGNGSFETGNLGEVPEGWTFSAGKAQAKMTVDDAMATDGKHSLLISNTSAKASNVFGMLSRPIRLRPDVRYTLSCDMMGVNARDISFAVGNSWRLRLKPPAPTVEWKRFKQDFTLDAKELGANGETVLRILTENLADVARIDNLRIYPAAGEVLNAVDARERKLFAIPRVSGKPLPGIPQGFPTVVIPAGEAFFIGGALPPRNRMSADFSFGFDDDGIWFFADVKEQGIDPGQGQTLWNADSIQLRICPKGSTGGALKSDMEFGFSPKENGFSNWFWGEKRELAAEEATLIGGIVPGGYRLAAHLKWELFPAEMKEHRAFSFNMIVNSLKDGKRRIAFYAPGIHDGKTNANNLLALCADATPQAFFQPVSLNTPQQMEGVLLLHGAGEKGAAEITDAAGNLHSFPLADLPSSAPGEIVVRELSLPLARVAEGAYDLCFYFNGTRSGQIRAEKVDRLARQLPALKQARLRLEHMKSAMPAVPSRYLTLAVAVLDRQITRHQRYLTQEQSPEALEHHLRQGEIVVPELEIELDRLEKQLSANETFPATWSYRTGKVSTYRQGIPVVSAVNEQGEKAEKPHFFVGYGHFDNARSDIEYFPSIAADVLQLEIGPRDVFPTEGKNGEFSEPTDRVFRSWIEQAMKRAHENNVQLSLLLSPHYHPQWWLAKYPELKAGNGMARYEINAPEAREMVGAYLDYIVPLIRDSRYVDALHSIVISNEPVYFGANWKNEFTRKRFRAYLEKRFDTIAAFNALAGTHYASFDAVMASSPEEAPAIRFAFHNFRFDELADFHRFLADRIRSHFPEVKLSAKIMVGSQLTPIGVEFASEPERFAEFSDYNGNDNYMNYKSGRFISDWVPMAMGHDLQYSMRRLPVLNTECHIIADGETGAIPSDHIYTAIFEQFLQGVGGIVTWVWAENTFERYQKDHPLRNNIYHRPSNIIAHGRAMLDGNRLAEDILTFVAAEPEVALLYSTSSQIQNGDRYCRVLRDNYETLSFTGRKIGFISEKQLARNEFGKYRLILLTGTTHLSDEAVAGLARFAEQGGTVLQAGDAPAFNSYGKEMTFPRYAEFNATMLPPLPFALNGNLNGVLYRAVPAGEGSYLVNIVNYNFAPVSLSLAGTLSRFELIRQVDYPESFSLPPLTPLFLRVKVQ